ncbi:hypothetical protein LA080_000663 [Diaporthe eres]|nr:hypothetical protein LA080_000663 [Diaporthe eres]
MSDLTSGGRISRLLGGDNSTVTSPYPFTSKLPTTATAIGLFNSQNGNKNNTRAVIVKRYVKFGSSEILISAGIRLSMEGAFEAVSEFGAIMEELNAR